MSLHPRLTFGSLGEEVMIEREDVFGQGGLLGQSFQDDHHLLLTHRREAVRGENPTGAAHAAVHWRRGPVSVQSSLSAGKNLSHPLLRVFVYN